MNLIKPVMLRIFRSAKYHANIMKVSKLYFTYKKLKMSCMKVNRYLYNCEEYSMAVYI